MQSAAAGASAAQLSLRIRRGGVVVGLLATFVPPTIALVAQWADASLRDILSLAVPFAIALTGWTVRSWRLRVALGSIGAYAYLASVVLLDSTVGITWPPVASTAFAASVVVISGTTSLWALAAVAASAFLCAIGVMVDPISTYNISVDLLGGWITPLVQIGLGLSFFTVLRVWDAQARDVDRQLTGIREQLQEAVESDEAATARSSVDRRIHETVLNTLNAMLVSESRDAIREQCRRDRDFLSRSEGPSSNQLTSLVRRAIDKVPELRVTVEVSRDVDIADEDLQRVLVDATTEALRNVSRHAGVSDAEIRAEVGADGLSVTITDGGLGMPEHADARFGSRSVITASVTGVGGSATWRPADPRGTTVELRLPHRVDTPPVTPPASTDALLGSVAARFALVATVWIGLIAVPVAAFAFTLPWAIIAAYAALVGCTLLLILRWESGRRVALSTLVVTAALVTMGVAALGQQGCTTAVGFHWIIFTAAGSAALTSLAQRSIGLRITFALVPVLASGAFAMTSPAACRLDAVDAALENALWVGAIVTVVTVLATQVDRYRRRADADWLETIRLRARAWAARKAEARWDRALASVDGMLESVADGSVDPLDPAFRHRVLTAQAWLRSQLELGQLRDDSARDAWEAFLDRCARASTRIRLEVLAESQTVPTDRLLDDVLRMAVSSQDSAATVSILAHGLLVRFTGSAIDPETLTGWSVLDAAENGGWTLESSLASPASNSD